MQILRVSPPASPLEMSAIRAALSTLQGRQTAALSGQLRYQDAEKSRARPGSWAALARLEALDDGV